MRRVTKMLIGVAGKKKSGKTLLANFLCAHYDAVKVPFAGTLKGAIASLVGPVAWRPQYDSNIRSLLQRIGQSVRDWNAEVWVKAWEAVAVCCERVVVPDVRYANEFDAIRRRGGVVIALAGGESGDTHPSELVPIEMADYIIDAQDPYNERQRIFREAVSFLSSKGYEPSGLPPAIYVASNISSNPLSFSPVFDKLSAKLHEAGFDPILPCDTVSARIWTERVNEVPFPQASRELVLRDISDISRAHGVLGYITAPSIGVAMEIMSAVIMDKPIAIVTPLSLFYHPWLHTFAKVFWDDIDEAISWLASCLTLTE